ncbi:MAG: hypothetical protein C5B52_00840 [Bacteroidetes bacterium]|nr:MAG: hypothetical protein C5B52_00840 [Bacteroidota bacterium]
MRKIILLAAGMFLSLQFLNAQTAEDSVKTTVNKLFEAMKNSDGALLKSTFADSAILQTIGTDNTGASVIKNETVADFADIVSKQTKGSLDERIEFGTIKIDGALAMVWAPYKFYYNGTFSHCGVDAFQLVRMKNGWKIQYLIDTRRKSGCN